MLDSIFPTPHKIMNKKKKDYSLPVPIHPFHAILSRKTLIDPSAHSPIHPVIHPGAVTDTISYNVNGQKEPFSVRIMFSQKISAAFQTLYRQTSRIQGVCLFADGRGGREGKGRRKIPSSYTQTKRKRTRKRRTPERKRFGQRGLNSSNQLR